MLLWTIVVFGTVGTWCYGCEYERILSCASGIQKGFASTRFIVRIHQLNTYCENMENAHRCILAESQSCQADLKASYVRTVKAEQLVIRNLCRPGSFQDEYLREAICVSSIYSERSGGPCRKPYSKLLVAAFNASSSSQFKKNEATSPSDTTGTDPAALLYNMCCAYYAVYECTQAHAGRCEGGSLSKNPLRQIYQGLDHNCRPFRILCNQVPSTSTRFPDHRREHPGSRSSQPPAAAPSAYEAIITLVFCLIVSFMTIYIAFEGLVM